MTKTEELREKMQQVYPWLPKAYIDSMLRICKDKGLVFVDEDADIFRHKVRSEHYSHDGLVSAQCQRIKLAGWKKTAEIEL